MQKCSISNVPNAEHIEFMTGDICQLERVSDVCPRRPFDEEVMDFLNDVSKELLSGGIARGNTDVVTWAFWIRKSAMVQRQKEYQKSQGKSILWGRGVVFHIAPSNVPVNFAYSLAVGLITGNVNIVRIPSKHYEQVNLIVKAINKCLDKYQELQKYIFLVRYERDRSINDYFSWTADCRVVWGGDQTISDIRMSPIRARTTEITFADRFSIAVIDSDEYLQKVDKRQIAQNFYNDTYLTDQNACTSPRLVVWMGEKKEKAKKKFWEELHNVVMQKYEFQPIMGVDKMAKAYMAVTLEEGVSIASREDNLIYRVSCSKIITELAELKGECGFFWEYDCDDIMELKELCNDVRCQTVGYLGPKETIEPLLYSGIKGIDRVVPIGKTMDFDFIWDGYNLFERLTRTIQISI